MIDNFKYLPISDVIKLLPHEEINISEVNEIVNKLMESGIIVRHLKSFGWPNYIRISTGLEKENKRLISQLKAIL